MNDFNKKDPLKLFLVQNDVAPKEAPHFEYTQILQKIQKQNTSKTFFAKFWFLPVGAVAALSLFIYFQVYTPAQQPMTSVTEQELNEFLEDSINYLNEDTTYTSDFVFID